MSKKNKRYDEDDDYINIFPIRKTKRIRNDGKRNKTKNNRGRPQGGGTADQRSQGEDY